MTTQEILVKYLTDMHALEKHLEQPLKTQSDDADFGEFPEAHALVRRLQLRTQNAVGALEIVLLQHGYHVQIGAGVRAALEVFLDRQPAAAGDLGGGDAALACG